MGTITKALNRLQKTGMVYAAVKQKQGRVNHYRITNDAFKTHRRFFTRLIKDSRLSYDIDPHYKQYIDKINGAYAAANSKRLKTIKKVRSAIREYRRMVKHRKKQWLLG